MKKNCELCKCVARVYCESDQASLCWSCDAKVHSANFLVARHVRSLLCYLCQTQTPWSGSGHKLGRTISVCEPCVKARVAVPTNNNNNTQSEGASDENSESGIDYDSEDNQVVPLSSSSSSETHRYRPVIDINISPEGSDELVADLKSKDDLKSSSPRQMDKVADEDAYIDSSSLRPFKFRKLEVKRVTGAQNNSTAGSRIQLRRDRKIYKGGAEAHECVDLDLNECPI